MSEVLERVDVLAEFRDDTEPVLNAAASRETPRRISVATVEQYDQVRVGNLVPAVAAFIRLFGLSPRGMSSQWEDRGDHILVKRWAKGQPPKFLRANYTVTGGEYIFDEPLEVSTATKPLPHDTRNAFSVAGASDKSRPRGSFSVVAERPAPAPGGAFSVLPRRGEEDANR